MTHLRSRAFTVALVIGVGLLVLIVSALGAVKLLGDSGTSVIPVLALAFAGIVALFFIPVAWLPAAAIVLFAVIPDKITPSDGVFAIVPPITFVILIWVFRRVVLQQRDPIDKPGGARVTAPRAFALLGTAAFIIWSALSVFRSVNSTTSLTWTVAFGSSAVLVMVVPSAIKEAALLREAWIRVGFIFGLYATLELALQRSPLYGPIYDALGIKSIQHWSVYRSEGSFGHPISAGAFLAPAAILGIAAWLQHGRKRHLMYGIGSALGVIATVSRGSIAAMAVGIGLALLFVIMTSGPRSPWRIITALGGGAIAGVLVLIVSPLGTRAGSVESANSTEARDAGITLAVKAAGNSGWFGTGAGTSGLIPQAKKAVVIESSLLQILVSLGIPGLALFCFAVIALCVNALRSRDIAAASALVTFVVAVASFNSFDAIRSQHLLLGMLFLICLFPAARPPKPTRRNRSQFGFDTRSSPYLASRSEQESVLS